MPARLWLVAAFGWWGCAGTPEQAEDAAIRTGDVAWERDVGARPGEPDAAYVDATPDAARDPEGDSDEGCADSDRDGVCDDVDRCPGEDDAVDRDGDGAVDGCEIRLPVEVMGPTGTRVAIDVHVDAGSTATHLYLQCYSCGYRDRELDRDDALTKAGVRVNGGSLIVLKRYTGGEEAVGNDALMLLGDAEAYGGIGGGFHTVEMVVPVAGLVDGWNTLEFEHVDARPPSVGFRILDIDLLTSPDPEDGLLRSTDRLRDDPSWWHRPDADDPQAVAGADVWRRQGLYDPLIDALDGDGIGVGTASCASCHASDGRDLQYFNYSSHSIIERALYHGLSREEGEQLSAYIRSLDVDLAPDARPWNPPYQPGPGLDDRPVHEWAAGAGLQAVLADDADMEGFLFPEGVSSEAVAQVVDRFGSLNMRELPIALQLPDWNQWLPPLHPADAYDVTSDAVLSDEEGGRLTRPFWDELYEHARREQTPESLGNLVMRLSRWLGREATCFSASLDNGPGWRAGDGPVSRAAMFGNSRPVSRDCAGNRHDPELVWGTEIAKRSVLSWSTVRQWELIHGQGLEQAAAQLTDPICAGPTCVSAAEARGWHTEGQGQGKNVFNRAPHYIGYRPESFTFQDEVVGHYESTSWYHLQLILNPGYRRTAPSHFVYTINFVENLQRSSGVSQSFRFWAGLIKQRQQQTNGRYGVEAGLDLRTAQPYYYYSDRKGRTEVRADVGERVWRRLIAAFLQDLVEDAANATPEDWAAANQNREVQAPDSDEFEACDDECWSSGGDRIAPFDRGPYQGRNTLRVVPRYRELGVDAAVLERLLDWSEQMWPLADWDSVAQP